MAKKYEVSERTIRRLLNKHEIPLTGINKKAKVNCDTCNVVIYRRPSAVKVKNYCSQECYSKVCKKKGPKINRSNQRFNNWLILEHVGEEHGEYTWNVKCKCGYQKVTRISNIITGRSKSCLDCYFKSMRKFTTVISPRLFKHIKREALKRNKVFNVTIEYLGQLLISQNYKCALSGKTLHYIESGVSYDPFLENISLDRIDSNFGYIEENVQWTTKNINMMKRILTNSEFISICSKVYSHHNKNTN